MLRNSTMQEARSAVDNLVAEGKKVELEVYRDGTRWHTDFCGTFIDDFNGVPDDAVCNYTVMDKEEYAATMLANTGTSVDEYFDDLAYIVVVNVQTDANDEYVTKKVMGA